MYKLSIVIFSNTETDSLRQTIQQIVSCLTVPYEIIVILKSENCPSAGVMKQLLSLHPEWNVKAFTQKHERKLDVFCELLDYPTGTHVVIWTSDNEVSARRIADLANVSLQHPDALVAFAKFHKDSVLENYGKLRKLARKSLNNLIRILYHREGDDFFSTYQIIPLRYFKELNYSANLNLMFEYSLIPLKLGIEYIELPARFQKGKEKSDFGLLFNCLMGLIYAFNIVKIRFTPDRKLYR